MDEDNDIVIALRRGEDGWEYAAADEIEALRAENARLREALKPFAEAAEGFRDEVSDEYPFQFGDFRLGQCRAARAAYLGEKDD